MSRRSNTRTSHWRSPENSTTSATFSQPGDYMLNVTANDYSGEGGGGFQCCWTTAKLKVTVQR